MTRKNVLLTGLWLACAGVATSCSSEPPQIPEGFSVAEGRVTAEGLREDGILEQVTRVRAFEVLPDGALREITWAPVDPSGEFALVLPADTPNVYLEAVDAEDRVLGAGLLGHAAPEGEEVRVAPLDRETGFEAVLYRELVSGYPDFPVNHGDLRQRVDRSIALRLGTLDGPEARLAQEVLAEGIVTSQLVAVRGLQGAGLEVSPEEIAELQRPAVVAYDEALYLGEDRDDAEYQLRIDLIEGWETEQDFDEHALSELQSQTFMAYRLVVANRLEGEGLEELVLDVFRASAEREAIGAAAGLEVTAAQFPELAPFGDTLDRAGDALLAELRAAEDVDEMIDAWGAYERRLVGIRRSLLGSPLAQVVPAALRLDALQAMNRTRRAANALDREAVEAVDQVLDGSEEPAPEEVADAIASVWSEFSEALEEAVAGIGLDADRQEIARRLALEAIGTFRALPVDEEPPLDEDPVVTR